MYEVRHCTQCCVSLEATFSKCTKWYKVWMASSTVVRKTAYGRTQLFLTDSNILLKDVSCTHGTVKRDAPIVFHTMNNPMNAERCCCWHCCEEIDDPKSGVPMPRVYDTEKNKYYVYGITCSPSCAKAYILEHCTFDLGSHLNVFVHMMRHVYGINEPIIQTPPRPSLKRFGGMFDPKRSHKVTCHLLEPPFVSYCMIAEERSFMHKYDPHTLTDISKPQAPALFDEFLKEHANETAPPVLLARKKRKSIPSQNSVASLLS